MNLKISAVTKRWLTIFGLIFYAHAGSVCMSIRYGFLADAFTKRNVSGKVYGLVGTSVFASFLFMYVFQITEKAMKRWNSKVIIVGNMLCLQYSQHKCCYSHLNCVEDMSGPFGLYKHSCTRRFHQCKLPQRV